jgi:hypothetical protein
MKIKFYYCNKEYYFKDTLVFTTTKKFDDSKLNKCFIEAIRHPNSYNSKEFRKLSDKELLAGMVIKELPEPKTFPKFNNEKPFKLKWDKKIIRNPEIIAIRWNGYNWEYQIKNIGHEYDFQPEDKLFNK